MSGPEAPWKPTKEQLAAAVDKTVDDIVGPNLRVLFCGINPGLYTAAIGHHFGRPANRFWKVLHLAGFTPRQLSPFEERELLDYGIGVTNVVSRTTATAAELDKAEIAAGGVKLRALVDRWQPQSLAVLGVQAYRSAFGQPKARVGKQDETWGATSIWVLPNPSGLQASYQLDDMVMLFTHVRDGIS